MEPLADSTSSYVGARLRERRKELGMTQKVLGEALAISPQQVQKYEHGINRMNITMLQEAARVLQIGIEHFLPDGEGRGSRVNSPSAGYDSGTPLPRDAQQLLRLFMQIQDPALRKQVLQLTKTLQQATQGRVLSEAEPSETLDEAL